MRIVLLLLTFLTHAQCSAPGPLATDREPDQLFGSSEDNLIVVDAILIVDAPLTPVFLRRTAAPGTPYESATAGLIGAHLTIQTGEAVFGYRPDPDVSGRYLPEKAPLVEPDRTYELRVSAGGHPIVRARTHTPQRINIDELTLVDPEDTDDEETVLRRLRLFSEIGEEVYHASENQLEYLEGILKAKIRAEGEVPSYQATLSNLEHFSPMLFANDWIDEDEVERGWTSPPLAADDGSIYLPWNGVIFAGSHKMKFYAVDTNWFDLVRTDNVESDRSSGEAGQGFQRPLFNIENGIGLFGSAAVDSVGFFVRARGASPCSGCECWGCERRPTDWSATLDPETGSGSVTYFKETGGVRCKLSYEISSAASLESCAECSFAWEFTLDNLQVSAGALCGDADKAEGETMRFGQAKEITAPEGGTPEHALYHFDFGWTRVERGWSLTPSDGEFADLWLFGFSND